MDWVIGQAFKVAKAAGKLASGIGGKKPSRQPATEPSLQTAHDVQVEQGLHAIDEAEERVAPDDRPSKEDAEKIAAEVKRTNPIFKSIDVEDGGDHWDYRYVASSGKKRGKAVPKRIQRMIDQLETMSVAGIDQLVKMLRVTKGRVREGYVFQAERTLYWNRQPGIQVIAVELPFSFTSASRSENSQFDIVLMQDELQGKGDTKNLVIFIDTKNWQRANELDRIITDPATPPTERARAYRELDMWADRMQVRMEKYRRGGVAVRVEWKGNVPPRIQEFQRTRSKKVYGSIEIVSI
jgi:hypothetical protein